MSNSVFGGMKKLRSEYFEMPSATLATATNEASSLRIAWFKRHSHALIISNETDVEITLLLVHPEDTDDTVKQLFIKIGPYKSMTMDLFSLNLQLDNASRMYIYGSSGTVASGTKVRLFTWG